MSLEADVLIPGSFDLVTRGVFKCVRLFVSTILCQLVLTSTLDTG